MVKYIQFSQLTGVSTDLVSLKMSSFGCENNSKKIRIELIPPTPIKTKVKLSLNSPRDRKKEGVKNFILLDFLYKVPFLSKRPKYSQKILNM